MLNTQQSSLNLAVALSKTLRITMTNKLKDIFYIELEKAKVLINEKRYSESFIHLERAHVIGQKNVVLHTVSHLQMLKVAFLSKDMKEILGQLFRLPLGIVGSLVGIVPIGNTGGSNVSAFKRMELPEDIKNMMVDNLK